MLVMSLLVLDVALLQGIMKLLLEMLDSFNKFGSFDCLSLSVGGLCQ
jgi:hypothetical protein